MPQATTVRAVLGLRAVLDSDEARRVRLRTEVGAVDHEVDPAGRREQRGGLDRRRGAARAVVAPGLGDAVLHDLRVAVALDDDEMSDERRARSGSARCPCGWVCSVNGERLFLKGACHGPTRAALAEATAEVRADVDYALAAGLDLLRVQGRGPP